VNIESSEVIYKVGCSNERHVMSPAKLAYSGRLF
jgi:hypothetical protein